MAFEFASLFSSRQPQQNQQQQQQQGTPQPTAQPVDKNTPPNNPQIADKNQPVNPLDAYSKMFDNPGTEADKPPAFSIDPKLMDQVVSSQDFMHGIDPALMEKAQTGDVKAMMELMQHVGRNSYRAAMEHNSLLTDKFVGAREAFSEKQLPHKVREHLTTNELSNTPNFQHPVVKKQLSQIASQLSKIHPDAAPQEIAKMAREYFVELSKAITPEDKSATQSASSDIDWNKFFDNEEAQT